VSRKINSLRTIDNQYSTKKFPKTRRATIDLLKAAKRKNMIHGMVEIDIAQARSDIQEIKQSHKYSISLTAFIIYCVSKSVASNKRMHAYRNWKNQLVLFDNVDVSTTVERILKGESEVVPMIIRAANNKSIHEISKELKESKSERVEKADVYRSIKLFLAIPAFFRQLVFRLIDKFPHLMKRKAGTVMVTSVGMMLGKGAGWGIPIASHTLNITIGGIVERPILISGQLENREHICLTVSMDHDIVDGAPASRFVHKLKTLIAEGVPRK